MIWMAIAVCGITACVILILYTVSLKRALRGIKKELLRTEEMSYNRQLKLALFDKDLTELAAQLNHNLDYQKRLKLETKQSELSLRQSVSDIAHDLRTPLTVIRGNLQMLEQEELTGKGRERLSVCRNKVGELGEMVDSFFEMSVLESDSSEADLGEVDLTKILMQFIVDHEVFIREHDLIPEIRLPERAVIIQAEERLLLRMLENLLGNVVKYARENFALYTELTEDNRCRIVFANAVGEEQSLPEDVSWLFQRTYRGSASRSGKGAGLGLYIVKLLAEKQKGTAEAWKEEGKLCIGISFLPAGERG